MRRVNMIAGLLLAGTGLFAQSQPANPIPTDTPNASASSKYDSERCGLKRLDRCFTDVVHDQMGIWTSPLRAKPHDAIWLVPFAGATAAAFAYDVDALRQVGTNKSLTDKSEIVSRFGSAYASFGEAAVMYFVGSATHNEHLRETGVLGAEAVVNASLVTGALKLVTNRERPDEGTGMGGFWPHGPGNYNVGSSFPSGHSASSWALARVIAAEYPKWQVRLGAYGFATAISVSRITGRRHFPSDVVVGGTLGYLIGDFVVRHHSTQDDRKMTFSVMPVIDGSQRTYGMTLAFTPSSTPVVQMGRTFGKFKSMVGLKGHSPASQMPGESE